MTDLSAAVSNEYREGWEAGKDAAYAVVKGMAQEATIGESYAHSKAYERIEALTPPSAPQSQHEDDVAVDEFAAAMKAKLATSRKKGRGGWQDCRLEDLWDMLKNHVAKGDPIDIANFCMFIWSISMKPKYPVIAEAIKQAHKDNALFRDVKARELLEQTK